MANEYTSTRMNMQSYTFHGFYPMRCFCVFLIRHLRFFFMKMRPTSRIRNECSLPSFLRKQAVQQPKDPVLMRISQSSKWTVKPSSACSFQEPFPGLGKGKFQEVVLNTQGITPENKQPTLHSTTSLSSSV